MSMLGYVLWIVRLLLLLAIVGFVLSNREHAVVRFWPLVDETTVPVWFLVFSCFASGLLFGVSWFAVRRCLRALARKGLVLLPIRKFQRRLLPRSHPSAHD